MRYRRQWAGVGTETPDATIIISVSQSTLSTGSLIWCLALDSEQLRVETRVKHLLIFQVLHQSLFLP